MSSLHMLEQHPTFFCSQRWWGTTLFSLGKQRMSYNWFTKIRFCSHYFTSLTRRFQAVRHSAEKLSNSIPQILGETKACPGRSSTLWRKRIQYAPLCEQRVRLERPLVLQRLGKRRGADSPIPGTSYSPSAQRDAYRGPGWELNVCTTG